MGGQLWLEKLAILQQNIEQARETLDFVASCKKTTKNHNKDWHEVKSTYRFSRHGGILAMYGGTLLRIVLSFNVNWIE